MKPSDSEPLISAKTYLPEITIKVVIFSVFFAIILAASNIYLALKIGTTISASIPASVMALGILRFYKNSNVLECNLLQTAASAGEGLAAALSFVLPAMIIIHFWNHFPYWETFLITILGGLLGVLFSIPLRRVLLNMPVLRFPEGVATGNLLRFSVKGGTNLKLLAYGGGVGGFISLCQIGLKVISSIWPLWMMRGGVLFGLSLGFNPATLAAGFIVGFEVGVSVFVGFVAGWIVLLPIFSVIYGAGSGSPYDTAMNMWSTHLRFVGVGTMLLGGLWTLVRLLKPVIVGIKLSTTSLKKGLNHHGNIPRTDRDIPLPWMIAGVVTLSVMLFILILSYLYRLQFPFANAYLIFSVVFIVLFLLISGFLLSTVTGYFTGLIGSSNNPLSGLLISALILLGFCYLLLFGWHTAHEKIKVIALLIVTISLISGTAAISVENIQDLKAGQMVGSTPWKQQLILGFGVVVSAFVVGPIFELLFNAYGIGGVYPRSGMDPSQMLAAPQSALMAAVAQGIIGHHGIPWNMIIIGGAFAIVIIIIDEFLKNKNFTLPVLAVGLGIYLPPDVMLPVAIGGFVAYFAKRKLQRISKTPAAKEMIHDKYQRGILLSCGLVAGTALMGVILAIPFVIIGSADALNIVPKAFAPIADVLGLLSSVGLCYWIYRVCISK